MMKVIRWRFLAVLAHSAATVFNLLGMILRHSARAFVTHAPGP